MSTEPVETVLDALLADPAAPAAPADPEETALLQVEAACKICRGSGEEYLFKNDQPYLAHLKQRHPECFVEA